MDLARRGLLGSPTLLGSSEDYKEDDPNQSQIKVVGRPEVSTARLKVKVVRYEYHKQRHLCQSMASEIS